MAKRATPVPPAHTGYRRALDQMLAEWDFLDRLCAVAYPGQDFTGHKQDLLLVAAGRRRVAEVSNG